MIHHQTVSLESRFPGMGGGILIYMNGGIPLYLFMHRKDLRTADLRGFDYMASARKPGIHLFVLDPAIHGGPVDRSKEHSGIAFLTQLQRLESDYRKAGSKLHILYGDPVQIVAEMVQKIPITEAVYHNDYTPYAKQRDQALNALFARHQIPARSWDDHLLADPSLLLHAAKRERLYQVFTPFYRQCISYLQHFFEPSSSIDVADLWTVDLSSGSPNSTYSAASILDSYAPPSTVWPPEQIGSKYISGDPQAVLAEFLEDRMPFYAEERDRYADKETSGISLFLNAGAISVRQLYSRLTAYEQHESWLRQLIWREFYMHQAVLNDDYYRYETLHPFIGLDDRHFTAWSSAQTGIPIIDAAMTELNQTGRMPNRLRMLTAMFLTKHLLCPFPIGEAWFRRKLSDADNTLNRGGWLWSASLGYDPVPYFRIMNPVTQSQRYDPAGSYIRRWLPELNHLDDKQIHLPQPHAIVDLKLARTLAIDTYRIIKSTATATLNGKNDYN